MPGLYIDASTVRAKFAAMRSLGTLGDAVRARVLRPDRVVCLPLIATRTDRYPRLPGSGPGGRWFKSTRPDHLSRSKSGISNSQLPPRLQNWERLGTEPLVRGVSWPPFAFQEAHACSLAWSASPNVPEFLAPRATAHVDAIESRSCDASHANPPLEVRAVHKQDG